jgi:hypothetical protein
MIRTFDAALVNDFLNDPAIRPTVGGEGVLDASVLLADRRNVCLLSEAGGALFAWRGPGVFEGHSFFRCRGREAISLGRALLANVFNEHGARMVWGLTPIDLKHVRWFNRKLGFVSHGITETPDGLCELFVMEGLCP